ncbi:MAG: TIM barrel protein [Aeromonadales bacterium]|jgi:sugar phosphate isomerase/epimerase|nr:TIM barrel protein [Aeromonadales bacterium]MDY2890735.1 TIM barrel protein [Succinivibrio sp.]
MGVSKRDYIIPSAHLAELYHSRFHDGTYLARKVEHIVQDGFYRSIELPVIEGKEDRRRILKALSIPSSKVGNVIVWSGLYAAEHGLDINSVDEAVRRKSVDAIKKLIEESCELGSGNFGVVSGRNVGILDKSDAYRALIKSLTELTAFAKQHKQNLIFEALEKFSGRRALLGTSEDTYEMMEILKPDLPSLYCCYDTAHAALNREVIYNGLEHMNKFIGCIHLSNAVLDPEDPLYGDNHLQPGLPGFLTVNAAARLISTAWKLGLNKEKGLLVCTELRQDDEVPEEKEQRCFQIASDFLKQIEIEFMVREF